MDVQGTKQMMVTPDKMAKMFKIIEREYALIDDGDDDEECVPDDWCAYDTYGSNVDDAYDGGVRTGRIELAKELMTVFNRGLG